MIPIWSIYFYGDTNSVLLLRIYYNICLDIIEYHHSGIDRKLRHYILIRCAKNQKPKKKKKKSTHLLRNTESCSLWFYILGFKHDFLKYLTTLFCILQPVLLLLFLWSTLHSTCIRGSVVLILTCLKMRRLRSTTVNPVNTRRMSWFICSIVLFNGVSQFSLIFILIWKNYLTLTVSVLVSFIHSCNPYMFILFHFLCD